MKKLVVNKIRKTRNRKHFALVIDGNDYEFVHVIAKNENHAKDLADLKYGDRVDFIYPMTRYTNNHLDKIDVIDFQQPNSLILISKGGLKNNKHEEK